MPIISFRASRSAPVAVYSNVNSYGFKYECFYCAAVMFSASESYVTICTGKADEAWLEFRVAKWFSVLLAGCKGGKACRVLLTLWFPVMLRFAWGTSDRIWECYGVTFIEACLLLVAKFSMLAFEGIVALSALPVLSPWVEVLFPANLGGIFPVLMTYSSSSFVKSFGLIDMSVAVVPSSAT